MSSGNCDFDELKNAINKCIYVSNNCDFEYFSMLNFNYCAINNNVWLTFILLALIIVLCFYFLSSTGNDYLAPALGIISEKMKLSQNLAGLTLLALGNQAPDVIVAFVAGDDENEGVETSLGSLLGGGIIVVGLVLSTVVMFGKEVQVSKGNYLRDLGVYLIALTYVLIIGIFHKLYIWEASLFFGLYILYVVICFIMDKKKKKEISNDECNTLLEGEDKPDFTVKLFNDSDSIIDNEEEREENTPKINDVDEINNNNNSIIESETGVKSNFFFDIGKIIKKSFFQRKAKAEIEERRQTDTLKFEQQLYGKFRYDLYRCYLDTPEKKWENKNIFQKTLFILVDFPFNLVRDATIPAYESSKWKRTMFIIQPFSISLFFLVIFKLYRYIAQYWYIVVSWVCLMMVLSFIFYRISYRTSLPSWHWLLLSSAFIISILWLWFITNILMDMIITVKLLLPIDIPQSFLSMTILAFGNSLPDFIVNTSLARTGYAEMALSGSIGAPVFGILFGFGLSLMKRLITNYFSGKEAYANFDLFNFGDGNSNKLLLISAISCIMLLLIGYMICGLVMNFKLKKYISFFGYSVYSVFFLSIIYFTFIHPHFIKS